MIQADFEHDLNSRRVEKRLKVLEDIWYKVITRQRKSTRKCKIGYEGDIQFDSSLLVSPTNCLLGDITPNANEKARLMLGTLLAISKKI